MLYGLYPDSSLLGKVALKPVMTLEAPVVRVTELGSGQGIGYGHSFHTTRPSRVATLRCGYADGYPRALGNRGRVLLGGGLAPVVGRVCMDHTLVDVTDLGEVREGDSAVMWGDSPSTEDVAVAAETISYELVARVGARVERRYKDD
jgi:alanine racemase